jgi:excisionase family DNA binding protein
MYVRLWHDGYEWTRGRTKGRTIVSVPGVTITEAAEQLGISREALRKRVIRGKIPAQKDSEGVWRIVLGGTDTADIKAADGKDDQPPDTLSAPTQQLQAVMDQWLRPLVSEIRELATENGRLKLENEQLRARLKAAERPAGVSEGESVVPSANVAPIGAGEAERALEEPRRRGWLARLLGWE